MRMVNTRGETVDVPAKAWRIARCRSRQDIQRRRAVRDLTALGYDAGEIADAIGVTPRRVNQILAELNAVKADAELSDEWAA